MHRLQPSLGNKTNCTQSPVVQNGATLPALTRQSQIRQNQAPCMGNIALHIFAQDSLAILGIAFWHQITLFSSELQEQIVR